MDQGFDSYYGVLHNLDKLVVCALNGSAAGYGVMLPLDRDLTAKLLGFARVPPAFVQNRCFARFLWDRRVRQICQANGMLYQGFSLLTANVGELALPAFRRVVARTGRTPAQVVFRFAWHVGMQPLTGTTSPVHMREDPVLILAPHRKIREVIENGP